MELQFGVVVAENNTYILQFLMTVHIFWVCQMSIISYIKWSFLKLWNERQEIYLFNECMAFDLKTEIVSSINTDENQ